MDTTWKIMLIGLLFFGGWLWSYIFIRQIMFNYIVAKPLIKNMRALQEDMIAIGADRYTAVSTAVCCISALVLLVLVIVFCPWYFSVSFAAGAVVAVVMLLKMVTPRNRQMFDSFCGGYYRFVPDDELRTALYNKKTTPIRARLKAMGFTETFIPDFYKK